MEIQTSKHHIQKERGATTMCKIAYLFLFLIIVCLVPWSSGEAASQQQFTLTVTKAGEGNGTVTSIPSGINCGSTCTGTFKQGKKVTLKAKADSSSVFSGWGVGCTGTGSCSVVMNSDVTVTATFGTKVATKVPEISVSPDSLDFGEVEIGKKVTETLTISNIGTGDLQVTVSGLEESDFSIVGKSNFTVKPQKSYNLKVTCKPTAEGAAEEVNSEATLSAFAGKEMDEELDTNDALTEEEADQESETAADIQKDKAKIIYINSNDSRKPTVEVPVSYNTPVGCPSGSSSNYLLQVDNRFHGTVEIMTNDTVEAGTINFTISKHEKEGYTPAWYVDCSGGSSDPNSWSCLGTTITTATWTANVPDCNCQVTFTATNTWKLTGSLADSCASINLWLEATEIKSNGWSGQCCGIDPNQFPQPPFLPTQGMKRQPPVFPFRPGAGKTTDCSVPPFTCTFSYTLLF